MIYFEKTPPQKKSVGKKKKKLHERSGLNYWSFFYSGTNPNPLVYQQLPLLRTYSSAPFGDTVAFMCSYFTYTTAVAGLLLYVQPFSGISGAAVGTSLPRRSLLRIITKL